MASDGNNERPGTGRREDSFLARWSRRKHEAEHGAPPETNEPPGAPEEPDTQPRGSEVHAEDTGAAGAEPEPTDADLPHPDTLDRDSDFSVYLTRRVSSAFRRAAMRRLFSSPEFNVRDGLDDYDEDYTQFKSLGDTVTAHMRHHAERLREREREKAERENEAERARTARQDEPTPEPDHDTDGDENEQATTTDNPTAAGHAPADTRTARTPDNRDTDDTT
jgi:hypothetical protein